MYSSKPKLHARAKAHIPGTLRTMSVDVTPRCNLNCQHCYASTFRDGESFSLDAFADVAEELYALGVFHYVLQGGEPIVDKPRLKGIIESIHPQETYINVVTNGWEMTRENIAWLKDLAVDKIAFSLDSGTEHEHDCQRGNGSFNRVMNALEDVQHAGLLTSISTVVTKTSLYSSGFWEALKIAKAMQIRIDVQVAMPVGKWLNQFGELIQPDDAEVIKQVQFWAGSLPNGQTLVHRDVFADPVDHCPAGTEFMAISADGHVMPCNFLQFSLGKIGCRPFAEMRRDLIASKWFNGKQPDCIGGVDPRFYRRYMTVPGVQDAYRTFDL